MFFPRSRLHPPPVADTNEPVVGHPHGGFPWVPVGVTFDRFGVRNLSAWDVAWNSSPPGDAACRDSSGPNPIPAAAIEA